MQQIGNALEGKVAVLTAATRSIGRAIAEAFLAQGARVVINGRSEDKGAAALAEIGAGDRLVFHPGSATDRAVVERLVDVAVEHFGRIDIAVANAGGTGRSAPIIAMPALAFILLVYFGRTSMPKGLPGGFHVRAEMRLGLSPSTMRIRSKWWIDMSASSGSGISM